MFGVARLNTLAKSQDVAAPGTPTYSISASPATFNEDGGVSTVITYTLTTTNVPDGTIMYFNYTLDGVDQGDISTGLGPDIDGSSTWTVYSNQAQWTIFGLADLTTEGNQSVIAYVYTDSGKTNLVATASAVTLVDTSLSPVTLTFVASTLQSGPTTIAMPAGAQVGDIVFVIDRLAGGNAAVDLRTPLTSASNSFTAHQTTSGGFNTTFIGCRISSRVLVAGELGTITNLANSTNTIIHRSMAVLFRPSIAITSTTYNITGGEYTTGNPAVQTVTVSNQPLAAMAMVIYAATAAVSPRTSGITMNELVEAGVTTFYAKYKLYTAGEARTNFTVDMDDEGSANLLQSFYVKFN
jgi:hypothetical protein